jgi:pSer/pThr/pTyr-binding forkhead associated (FHA) protein/tetratricopeptide (TPR) repeat protein
MAAPVVTIHKNGQALRSLTLDAGEAVLGRGEGCVIRLEDRAVSRQHAVLKSGPGGLRIEKKSHLAPLFVNGTECDSAALQEGDEVHIGPYVLRIAIPPDQLRVKSTVERGAAAETGSPKSGLIQSGGTASIPGLDGLGVEASSNDPFPSSSDASDSPALGDSMEIVSIDAGSGPVVDLPDSGGSPVSDAGAADAVVLADDAPGLGRSSNVERAQELSSIIEEDAKTRILPQASVVKLKLRFSPGSASIEMKEFDQEEVSLGRGKGCDVVLNDKKASRKHLIIRRAGDGVDTVFTIRDLESANGVYVNGARVTEHVLSGDDIVRVGDTEFAVQVVLPNYEKHAENFLKIDHELPIHEESRILAGMAKVAPESSVAPVAAPLAAEPIGAVADQGGGAFSNVIGVAGIPGAGAPAGSMSLMDRYRAMPQRSRMIWIGFIGMLVYTAMEELPGLLQPPPKKKAATEQVASEGKKKPAAEDSGGSTLPTFDQLKPDLQKFVESQYNLSLEYFRNRDYDRSLYEVRKIFQYVSDYKDARDLERYSVESKQRVQAQEDERRRKEAEQAAKARVARLVIEVEGHMARKEYIQARELFAEIVSIEPDNPQVAGWKKEIEVYEEAQERARLLRNLEQETLKKGREIVASGNEALRQRRWFRAIEIFKSVFELETNDKRILGQANSGISRARSGIASARDPLLEEGRRLEQESSYSEAFKKFSEARKIDPSSAEARNGMERVRGFLRDRSKQLYTEAVLAESYSDFTLAKTRFEQLLQVAPPDDPYYERARRKLSRYLVKEELPR